MDNPKPVYIYELCRLCIENEGVCDVFENEDLFKDIYASTGVIIYPSEKLPHKICIKCTDFIRNAKEFRLFVNKNDIHLRSMVTANAETDIIMTNVCHTPEVIFEPEKSYEEVRSGYFNNNEKDGDYQNKIELDTEEETKFEAGPVIIQTISLRKDLFYSSPSPCPTKTEPETEKDPYVDLLEKKVKAENICRSIKIDKHEEVDYICGICSKKFQTYKKFYLHQRLHNKRLECPLKPCGKMFAIKSDLDKHLRTHTGEKPFKCSVCNRGFTQKVWLRYHETKVHPMIPKVPSGE